MKQTFISGFTGSTISREPHNNDRDEPPGSGLELPQVRYNKKAETFLFRLLRKTGGNLLSRSL